MADAQHGTFVCVDVEQFGAPDRMDYHRVEVRARLYAALYAALARSEVSRDDCDIADRGDGVMMVAAPHVPTSRLVVRFPRALAEEAEKHNKSADPPILFRLRVAVHSGEVRRDEEGLIGQALNFTFRLVEAAALKSALRASPGNLVLITSDRVFEEIVRHDPAGHPGAYRRVQVAEKETKTEAWIYRPDAPYPPESDSEPEGDDPRHQEFERGYLAHVARALGTLELFGLAEGRMSRGHAYVRLAVVRADRRHEDEPTGAGLDVVTALEETPRVLLRGDAGAGKTTLLRRLATVVAEGTGAEEATGRRPRGAVPFFVPLRRVGGAELPGPEELLGLAQDPMAEQAPSGWATALFKDGRALLLVDGVDELPSARRAEVRDWLRALVSEYPSARCVVTTRPFAVTEDWPGNAGFVPYDLSPMSPNTIRDFLARWHAAAVAENAGDAAMQGRLRAGEERLAGLLSTWPELRRLAATPLLCGLLCALHQERGMRLPRDRKSLYDAALDLLLGRWNESVPGKEELLVLLRRLAYSFVDSRRQVVDRQEAIRRIGDGMHGLRSRDADPGVVLRRILDRTGLLTAPRPGDIEFPHRTFRDHLAAKEIVAAHDPKLLVEHAHRDDWHDVVVMAVAHARPRERAEILRGLLAGNSAARADEQVRDRLNLVVAACLEHTDVVGDDEAWAGFEWVSTCSADDFVGHIRAIREGQRSTTENGGTLYPGKAIQALHAFAALKNPIDKIVEFTESFHEQDASTVLTAAALCRTVEDAVELTVRKWDAERGRQGAGTTPLTDKIIHDIACQRTVPDVAVFVGECRLAGKHELAKKLLTAFAETNSGRKEDDKAQLYILLRDGGCGEEAADLLLQTLTVAEPDPTRGSEAAPAKSYDNLLGALRHVSPTERIVENWVDAQLRRPQQELKTRSIVAELIAGRTDGSDGLIEHVGKHLSGHDIADICGQLVKRSKKSPQCAAIRKHVASRRDVKDLAMIVRDWQHTPALTQMTEELLTDIVATGPRSPEELEHLSYELRKFGADPECERLLWIAAARHTAGRSGAEVVNLLNRVKGSRNRRRVAQTTARNLAADVLENGRDERRFVECVKQLRQARFAAVVYLALRELADPSSSDRPREGAGKVIAGIAAHLYDEGLEREGWDLLERFLENERRVNPQDVAVIVDRLNSASTMPRDDRLLLLRATVGRWADAGRRAEAVAELRDRKFDAEAAKVILSLR